MQDKCLTCCTIAPVPTIQYFSYSNWYLLKSNWYFVFNSIFELIFILNIFSWVYLTSSEIFFHELYIQIFSHFKNWVIFLLFIYLDPGIKPSTSYIQSMHSITELHSRSFIAIFPLLLFWQGDIGIIWKCSVALLGSVFRLHSFHCSGHYMQQWGLNRVCHRQNKCINPFIILMVWYLFCSSLYILSSL